MNQPNPSERPLSPHLQIYRWQITSVLSILHRATGVALTIGLFVFAWWLLALASGPEAYGTFRAIIGSTLGRIVMIAWSYALFYHLCTGIRHLVLDTGVCYNIPDIYKSGYAAVAGSMILTVGFWLAVIL